jgi:hypothetical protein
VPVVAAAPPEAPAAADPRHKTVSGTDIFLGMMRAESIRDAQARAGTGAAPAMEVPSGKGYYHVNISLIDAWSHVPVTDASVSVEMSDGMNVERKELGLVAANNSVSYGSFFRVSSGNTYNITADIRRPGVTGPIQARFEFKAP